MILKSHNPIFWAEFETKVIKNFGNKKKPLGEKSELIDINYNL